MGKLWGRLGKAPRIKKTVHSPNPLQTESIWFCEMKYFRKKKSMTKIKNAIWERAKWDLWNDRWIAYSFLSEDYENWSTRYVLCGPKPPPKQLNDWHPSFLFFVVNKHAYHGANRIALPPRIYVEQLRVVFCGVGRKLIWNWSNGDQMISTKLPRPHLELLCLCHPISISQNPPSVSSPFPKTLHISWLLP